MKLPMPNPSDIQAGTTSEGIHLAENFPDARREC